MSPGTGHDLIDLTGDNEGSEMPQVADGQSDEENLKLAIALSLSEAQMQPTSTSMGTVTSIDSIGTSIFTDRTAPLFSTLDRKSMEAERLARLKRKRESHHDAGRPTSSRPIHPHTSASPAIERTKSQEKPSLRMRKTNSQISHFPRGKVLRTASPQRSLGSHDSISFQELIKPLDDQSYLKSTLLSSFAADFDWLLPHFDTKKVSFVIVLNAQSVYHKQALERDFDGINNVRLVIPETKGVSYTQHSKLMLLFYEPRTDTALHNDLRARCRVVVPSANLVPHDWGIGDIMENMAFVIDLPKQDASTSEAQASLDQHDKKRTKFERDLRAMLMAMNVPVEVLVRLNTYDFSATADIGFVTSIGGSHIIQNQSELDSSASSEKPPTNLAPTNVRSGFLSLSDTISSLGFGQCPDDVNSLPKLDYIASSLGVFKRHFLSSLLVSACGQADKYLVQLCPSGRRAKPLDTIHRLYESVLKNLRIFFPSESTVRSSRGGPSSAGTICFASSTWNATGQSKFPRELLRDYTRIYGDQMLMHSKILYVRFARPKSVHDSRLAAMPTQSQDELKFNDAKRVASFAGWVYVGSANLSESAWGSVIIDKKLNTSRITSRNWESGVVIPVPVPSEVQEKIDGNPSLTLHDLSLHEVFGHIIPVPFKEPAQSYDDGRQPWFYRG